MPDERILNALKQEFESAKERHEATKLRRMLHAEQETAATLQKAVAEELCAFKERMEALERLNDYLLNGTVPGHLKEKRRHA